MFREDEEIDKLKKWVLYHNKFLLKYLKISKVFIKYNKGYWCGSNCCEKVEDSLNLIFIVNDCECNDDEYYTCHICERIYKFTSIFEYDVICMKELIRNTDKYVEIEYYN